MESPVASNREVQPEAKVPQHWTVKVHVDSPALVPARSRCYSHDPAQASPDLDTLSYDSTDSLREQVHQVHQRLDEVQKEVLKSKEGIRGELESFPDHRPEHGIVASNPPLSSFDLLAKKFELSFLVSARPKPTVTSLLGLAQGNEESLAQFIR
ncbi:hypothetical protein B296_00058323 [Ensete ventricosum]|uniref:Uncharacterized protein n=1 Tax=Ensete ventricosum TaxID=4639 RepID=A0A426XML9_ENSVE|nr:hypothetical protein B296_00058323 [Ensete ventricosum]